MQARAKEKERERERKRLYEVEVAILHRELRLSSACSSRCFERSDSVVVMFLRSGEGVLRLVVLPGRRKRFDS